LDVRHFEELLQLSVLSVVKELFVVAVAVVVVNLLLVCLIRR
jgi:hypothetical protein